MVSPKFLLQRSAGYYSLFLLHFLERLLDLLQYQNKHLAHDYYTCYMSLNDVQRFPESAGESDIFVYIHLDSPFKTCPNHIQ